MSVKEWLDELEYRIEALRLQPDDVVLVTLPADRGPDSLGYIFGYNLGCLAIWT